MKRQLIVLLAAVALLIMGAVPVSAAPGGIPGPPAGHEKVKDKPVTDTDDVEDDTTDDIKELPEWAKAYGKRIQDEYGAPYGHLQQCAAASADDVAVDEETEKPFECPEDLEFPEDAQGAKALWVFTEAGLLVVGV